MQMVLTALSSPHNTTYSCQFNIRDHVVQWQDLGNGEQRFVEMSASELWLGSHNGFAVCLC